MLSAGGSGPACSWAGRHSGLSVLGHGALESNIQ